jgi:hypothetical protein
MSRTRKGEMREGEQAAIPAQVFPRSLVVNSTLHEFLGSIWIEGKEHK